MQAQKILDENLQWADILVQRSRRTPRSCRSTSTTCDRCEQTEADPNAIAFQSERAADARRGLDADRRALDRALGRAGKAPCASAIVKRSRPPSRSKSAGPPVNDRGRAWIMINQLTMFGLIAIGVLPDRGLPDPVGGAVGGGVPGDDLPRRCRPGPACRRIPRPRATT